MRYKWYAVNADRAYNVLLPKIREALASEPRVIEIRYAPGFFGAGGIVVKVRD